MNKAHWIWYNGDFELYHSIKLHTRRQEYGVEYPTFWHLATPYLNVSFVKSFNCPEDFTFKAIVTDNIVGRITLDGVRLPLKKDINVLAGNHNISVDLTCTEGFPCVFIDSKYLSTDGSWLCNHKTIEHIPVGHTPEFASPNDDPRVFPFAYETLKPKKVEKIGNGTLYDFGKETFCRVTVDKVLPEDNITITFGESREEALDVDECLVIERLNGRDKYIIGTHAFRFLYVIADKPIKFTVEYEYLPIADRASFECSNRSIKKIWDTCSYTFHLNTREFYLDGIKRDRWVWSGDAYQSYKANNYLYFNPDITKRTIIALLGKPPFEQHVNSINDYTMYLIIGAYEYYEATGDAEFIKVYYSRIKQLYDFMAGRTDENDYICHRDGDWIFIDWSEMDKFGPMAAEQILYWRTKQVMAKLAKICGLDNQKYEKEAVQLQKRIMKDFWKTDKGAFIDCIGSSHITRHPNIFAILYDFVPTSKAKSIVKNVLNNDSITQITTPYFEFFELCARCKMGDLRSAQKKISSYWGGMVKLGATSIWEEFIPENKGIEHYSMYGMKYGCSLCHAWGSGPIYLLGRYCLGVYPTSTAYATFTVEPKLGLYKYINGSVPLPDGNSVSVYMDKKTVKVSATVAGGMLKLGNSEYIIEANKELIINI